MTIYVARVARDVMLKVMSKHHLRLVVPDGHFIPEQPDMADLQRRLDALDLDAVEDLGEHFTTREILVVAQMWRAEIERAGMTIPPVDWEP